MWCIVVAVAWLHGGGVNDGVVVGAYCVVAGVIAVVGDTNCSVWWQVVELSGACDVEEVGNR